MSDKNDLHTLMARSLARTLNACACDECVQYTFDASAGQLALAGPAIRADERKRLAQKALNDPALDGAGRDVFDWLLAQEDDPETRKIYIKG